MSHTDFLNAPVFQGALRIVRLTPKQTRAERYADGVYARGSQQQIRAIISSGDMLKAAGFSEALQKASDQFHALHVSGYAAVAGMPGKNFPSTPAEKFMFAQPTGHGLN